MLYGREINFTIPEPTILLNSWQRMHWAKRKKYHEHLSVLVRQAMNRECYHPLVPFKQCKIEIDRYSSGTADWDGVMGGLKPLFDTLVIPSKRNPLGLGIIEDDNPSCIIHCPVIRQHKTAPKKGETVVTITEILEI